jgi:hypothetical protein
VYKLLQKGHKVGRGKALLLFPGSKMYHSNNNIELPPGLAKNNQDGQPKKEPSTGIYSRTIYRVKRINEEVP